MINVAFMAAFLVAVAVIAAFALSGGFDDWDRRNSNGSDGPSGPDDTTPWGPTPESPSSGSGDQSAGGSSPSSGDGAGSGGSSPGTPRPSTPDPTGPNMPSSPPDGGPGSPSDGGGGAVPNGPGGSGSDDGSGAGDGSGGTDDSGDGGNGTGNGTGAGNGSGTNSSDGDQSGGDGQYVQPPAQLVGHGAEKTGNHTVFYQMLYVEMPAVASQPDPAVTRTVLSIDGQTYENTNHEYPRVGHGSCMASIGLPDSAYTPGAPYTTTTYNGDRVVAMTSGNAPR